MTQICLLKIYKNTLCMYFKYIQKAAAYTINVYYI